MSGGPGNLKLVLIRLVILIPLCSLLFAGSASAGKQVILLIADRLTLTDLTESPPPNIKRLVRCGAIGLINSTSAGRSTSDGAYAALGAGAGVVGSAEVGEGYDWSDVVEDSPAWEVYQRRAGREAPAGSVVNISVGKLITVNKEARSTGVVGGLGESLRLAGKRVAVFGNADIPEEDHRPAVTVAMDANGVVPEGVVGKWLLKTASLSPTGKVTDVTLLLRLVRNAATRADLIVIDFGDTSRLEEYAPRLSDTAHTAYLKTHLASLDRLVGGLLEITDASGGYLLFVSPMARSENGSVNRLAPALLYHGSAMHQIDRSYQNRHLITSATTRTPGLISVIDVAPTILAILGVSTPDAMIGRTIGLAKPADRTARMRRLDTVSILQTRAEWPLFGAIAAIGAVTITALALIVAFGLSVSRAVKTILRGLAAVALAFPLAMLLGSLYNGTSVLSYCIWIFGAAIIVVFALWAITRSRALHDGGTICLLPGLIALITSTVIVVDMLVGAPLNGNSMFSAFQVRGLRFYGIGNECMGILIGMTLLAILWVRQLMPGDRFIFSGKALLAAYMALVIAVLGLPSLGADVGGAITAVVAFGLCYKGILGRRPKVYDVITLLALSGVLVAVLGLLDLLPRDKGSHAGLTMRMIGDQGWSYLWNTITRKVSFNFQILGTRQAETALMAFVPFFMLWFAGVQKRFRRSMEGRPDIANGFIAVAVGAAVAFVVNDSGSVAGPLVLYPTVYGVLYSLVGRQPTSAET